MKKTQEIDLIVSTRIKQRRIQLGFSQADIAAKIAVSTQQYQKYEKGSNRITAGKLNQIAEILGENIGYFFNDEVLKSRDKIKSTSSKETEDLFKYFSKIQSVEKRKNIIDMIRFFSKQESIKND
jgi:transcriptional regulator with XRE-family HTH domain